MSLTAAQLVTLAAHIRASADAEVIAALATRNDTAMTAIYNTDSAFIVWRPTISVEEYRDALDWTEVDNVTAAKARIWEWATGGMTLPLESGKANVRAGLAQCWAANSSTRAALLVVAKRAATLAESIFASGGGIDGNPGDLVYDGQLSTADIGKALNENH